MKKTILKKDQRLKIFDLHLSYKEYISLDFKMDIQFMDKLDGVARLMTDHPQGNSTHISQTF